MVSCDISTLGTVENRLFWHHRCRSNAAGNLNQENDVSYEGLNADKIQDLTEELGSNRGKEKREKLLEGFVNR